MSARKVRECKRGCGYPALSGRQFCQWHALLRMSSTEQAAAAQSRLAATVGEHRARVPSAQWLPGTRWCAGCQTMIPHFYASGSRCKACASAAAHAARVEKTYGITADEYNRILEVQGGRCAICRNQSRTIRFAVDHDHQTGEVRGLLCKRCNHDLLGGGHDSIALLWTAIKYLLYPPAQGPVPVDDIAVLMLAYRLDEMKATKAPAPEVPPLPPPF